MRLLDAKGSACCACRSSSAAPETVLQEGEPAGFVTASRPLQMTWSESTESLTIIDDKRQAFAYFAGRGSLPLTVRASDSIGSFDAITGSGGNLYVLDVKSNQVWRYLPGQSGYDGERTARSTAPTARRHQAWRRQDVYGTRKRGIRRFVSKTEAAFPLAGIDTGCFACVTVVLPVRTGCVADVATSASSSHRPRARSCGRSSAIVHRPACRRVDEGVLRPQRRHPLKTRSCRAGCP
jgi:hypothetical protein